MASGESIAAWVDQDTKTEVERFRERHSFESLSEAGGELIEIGLRESTNPLVYRVKDRVVDWVSLLGISAVIVFIAGGTTNVLSVLDAAKLSLALVGTALVLLGGYELARLILGTNELGSVVRNLVGGRDS